jgi:hypothetical protein
LVSILISPEGLMLHLVTEYRQYRDKVSILISPEGLMLRVDPDLNAFSGWCDGAGALGVMMPVMRGVMGRRGQNGDRERQEGKRGEFQSSSAPKG